VQQIGGQIEWNVPFLLTPRVIEGCVQAVDQSDDRPRGASHVRRKVNLPGYCLDALEIVDIVEQMDNNANTSTPLLAMFGDDTGLDAGDLFDLPFFHKHRAVATCEQIKKVTGDISRQGDSSCWMSHRQPLETEYYQEVNSKRLAPIIWKRNPRHWTPLKQAAKMDTPWIKKKDLAFWRGIMTGTSQLGETDVETCRSNQRCSFVLDHAESKLIDCGLTNHHELLSSGVVDGTSVMKSAVDMKVYQQHKIIISLEGNDVASGLKWNLQSQSVVLMPPPTRPSWAMEELLQPWVHYIPMHPNGSNAEEMIRWALDNDMEAQRIAERATLFIYDFVYHADATKDECEVKKEIVRRYRDIWQ